MSFLFASCSGGTSYVGIVSYTVKVSDTTKGKVVADKTSAVEGDKITLTVTPDDGYELDTLTVKDADGKEVAWSRVDGSSGDVLLMDAPAAGTTAAAVGTVTVAPAAGSTVTVAVVRYTFTMPKSDVTVSATFKTAANNGKASQFSYDSYSTTAEKVDLGNTPADMFDNDNSTKWCINIAVDSDGVISGGIAVIFRVETPWKITKYSLTPGEDTISFTNRNPKAWKLFGSDSLDGTYTEIHSHSATDTELSTVAEEQYFTCSSANSYKYYKFVVNQLSGGVDTWGNGKGCLQLAELKLYTE